jgi:hypothetical protein
MSTPLLRSVALAKNSDSGMLERSLMAELREVIGFLKKNFIVEQIY